MITYKNNYFNIELSLPEEWLTKGWFNSRAEDKPNKDIVLKYQTSDDDIPKKNDEFKLLFSSLYIDKSEAGLIGSDFSIAVFYREQYMNLGEKIKEVSTEEERTLKSESILGVEAQSLFVIKNMRNYHLRSKFVTWEACPNLWLEAVIHGNSKENFNRTESIFKLMKKSSDP